MWKLLVILVVIRFSFQTAGSGILKRALFFNSRASYSRTAIGSLENS